MHNKTQIDRKSRKDTTPDGVPTNPLKGPPHRYRCGICFYCTNDGTRLTLAMQTFDSLIPKTMSDLEADLRWPILFLDVAVIGLQCRDAEG